jgi:hypothetical protein
MVTFNFLLQLQTSKICSDLVLSSTPATSREPAKKDMKREIREGSGK